MKTHKLGGACVVAVLFAMALAASAHANAQSSTAPTVPMIVAPPSLDPLTSAEVTAVAQTGIPLPQAKRAIMVQSAVEREALVNELEAALGDAYGGVWYVPAAAQLHVGVTSQNAARIAEAVAVRAGLGLYVAEIPVDSSAAELSTAQKELNRRLADLLAREEVATRASVEDNTVYVELGSAVPAGERTALEGEASEASVDVVVTVAPGPKLGVALQAQCRAFKPSKANCDPQIVGGTTLENIVGPECTTGPAVAQPKGSTEIYVLTAGHCIVEAKESFFAVNKEGTKTEEIGKVAAFLNPKAKNNADVAAIKVENAFWKKAGEIPVPPKIAQWSGAVETEPFKVKGEAEPVAKAATCISGQTSGFHCGVIKEIGMTFGLLEELVEVEKTKTEGGDSGAPWFSEKEKLVQGTHVGENKETTNPVFQPLWWSFQRLKEVSGLELELLTEKNEKRM